jgi:HEAT repeat protein
LLGDRMASADALAEVRILAALSDRGDKAARPILVSALRDSAVEVRVAALLGMGKLGDQSDVATQAQTAANATEAAEQQAARDGLYRLVGNGVDQAVVAGIANGDPKLRVELIKAAAERGIGGATPALIQAARDSDRNVRRESLRSLRETTSASDAAALVDLLKAAQGSDRREAERTLSSALARSANASLAPVVSAYQAETSTEVRASLLQVMAQLGKEEALPVLRGTLKDSNSDIRRAGILALTEWPTPAPMPDLLEIAQGDPNSAFQILALRGYIRLIGLPVNRPPAETAGMLAQAMSIAKQPDEKKAVLAQLPRAVCPESLKIAQAAMKDEAVASEAKMAVDRLRRALTPRKQQ